LKPETTKLKRAREFGNNVTAERQNSKMTGPYISQLKLKEVGYTVEKNGKA
jgi:hypothetical protein